MAFAIMRCKKLKGMGSVAGALKHCFRERETTNADASRTPDNEHGIAQSTDEAMGKLRELLPEKRRKDAVLSVEYLLTASPEWWKSASEDQQQEFFNNAHEWLAKKYGADRIIVASIHRDETSPHMSAFVVPLTQDGRLSAKDFIGDRKRMSQDQTDFAEKVASLGLERGIEGSKAHHTTIAAYYTRIATRSPKEPAVELPEPSIGDRLNPKKYGEKVAETVLNQLRPHLKTLAAKAQEADMAKEDKTLYQRLAKRSQDELKTARSDADREANERMSLREQQLEQVQRQANELVCQEQAARVHMQAQAKKERQELEERLRQSQQRLAETNKAHSEYVASLLNASDDQVLKHFRAAREAIQGDDRSADFDR